MLYSNEFGVVFNKIEVAKSKNVKINQVSSTHELENLGQTFVNLSIRNKTCNYDA